MKAILLNGAREDDATLNRSQEIITGELREREWEVRPFILREINIPHCLGCFGCWVKTPGLCVMKDATREIAGEFMRSDLAVLLTPVTFGGYSSELKKALDLAVEAFAENRSIPDKAVALMAKPLIPSWIYTIIGSIHWRRQARENGVKNKMNARPLMEESIGS